MKAKLSQLGELHDWTCVCTTVDGTSNMIELRCTYYDDQRVACLQFLGVKDFQFIDLAQENIIDSVREISFADLGQHGDFSSRYKLSIYRTIDDLSLEDREIFRLWVIHSNLGLVGAVLARKLSVELDEV